MQEENKLYEVAYHLLPVIAEGILSAEVDVLRGIIEAAGGVVEVAELPKGRALAYPIRKKIANVWQEFTQGIFGVIIFQASPVAVLEIKVGLDKAEHVMRFMITETAQYEAPVRREPTTLSLEPDEPSTSAPSVEEKAPMSTEDLDKEVDQLIAATV